MEFDLKITGGTVIDGTGNPRYAGDIGIRGGRIVAIGEGLGAARETLDAAGKVVAPGFVDIHTHYDAQIMWDRMLTISPWHGVTTVVLGNCGFGIAPTRKAHRPLIVRTLEKVEGMSVAALESGLGEDWGFETFPEYLDRIEAKGVAINVGVLLGHTPLRLYVMGETATERPAEADEIARMRALVKEALQCGALGFATSKLPGHVGFEGRPVPSRAAPFDELRELVGVIPEVGHGMIQTTLGPGLLLDQIEQLARETGARISWTALLAGSAFGKSSHQEQLARSRDMLQRGLPVFPQVSPRPLNFEFQFREPLILEGMSLFKPVSAADFDGKRRIYQDPAFRAAFRDRFDNAWPALAQAFNMIVIAECAADRGIEERRLVDVAAERGVHPVDLALDLALATGLEARFRMPVANHDESEVAGLLLDPGMVLGLSDAGAHASQLCDACQATYLLGHWVREKQALSLETAIRMLTSRPADVFGIRDRGRLAKGMAADIVVFDPDTVGAGPLKRVRDLPGDAERLVSEAEGVDAVIVNGVVLRRAGRDVIAPDHPLPGRLLRHGRAA
ncbi:N-acyl-D-amino-acid deacylase family protein [Vineibacter terrae]|uniref:N-acyl-D-amino-acid deacylase family protein n=1 Tax=Vineibacter terrae TaxID=2586908 RepID=UPI002E32F73C|nr:amidohydrolase family protein [Vineibacter terrae]HEX2884973.1 amidohydrolase family protein [Vineibacter terrae]